MSYSYETKHSASFNLESKGDAIIYLVSENEDFYLVGQNEDEFLVTREPGSGWVYQSKS